MDEREPDSAGRPMTRRELRERDAAAAVAAETPGEGVLTDGGAPAGWPDEEVVPEPDGAARASGAGTQAPADATDWGAEVRWSLHHELPPALHEDLDEDDVRWEPPAPSVPHGAGIDPGTAEHEEPGPASGSAALSAADVEAGPEAPTAALPQVQPSPGAVPRRRSVWLIDQQDEGDGEPEPSAAGEAPDEQEPAPAADAATDLSVVEPEPEPAPDLEPAGTEVPMVAPSIPGPQAPPAVDAPLPTLSDLLAARPDPVAGPAQLGWQGVVRRMTGGLLRLRPGPTERAHREAVVSVQRQLDGPRTIVVINPKGGAHKTTGTLLLAAAFGEHRGGYTLAWDNNETRGTLGWRSMPGSHQRTAVDLLQNLDRFTEGGAARVGDLDGYVRSQGSARFDVLASDEDAASAASVDAFAFRALHRTLSRFYRVMVVDTGNNMRASNWQAAIAAADQVVIVSTVREDTAQSAAWAIDALRATGHSEVVRNAVTVLSDPAPQRDAVLAARLHEHFGQLTRAVVDVPYDASLVGGSPLVVEHLDRRTREAWLRVAAVVAEGL